MRSIFALILLASPIFASGPLIIGGRGGASVTENNVISTVNTDSPSHSYVVGPTVGVRLPFGFSVEGDALFNRQSFSAGNFGNFNAFSTHIDSWEFPIMGKWSFGHTIAPVIGGGISFRHVNNTNGLPSYLLLGTTNNNDYGAVAGAGVKFRVGPVDVTPEIRYTRWMNNNNDFSQNILNLVSSSRNQAQVLVGITF